MGAHSLIITFVIDDKYLHQLLFVLYRCALNSIRDHSYVIFFKDLGEISAAKVRQLASLLNIRVQLIQIKELHSSFDNGHIARSSMLRLSVPHYLSQTYMHLDVDTLPLMGWDNIESFSPSADEILSAAPISSLYLEETSAQNEAVRVMGADYFQTGVYLLNPIGWNQYMLSDRVNDALNEYSDLGFQFSDQCILNYSIQRRYRKMPEAYNTFPSRFRFKTTRIIHFAGPNKPWILNYPRHFIILFRHSISARQTLSLLFKGNFFSAFHGFLLRFGNFIREFYCLFFYKICYLRFKKLFRTLNFNA